MKLHSQRLKLCCALLLKMLLLKSTSLTHAAIPECCHISGWLQTRPNAIMTIYDFRLFFDGRGETRG